MSDRLYFLRRYDHGNSYSYGYVNGWGKISSWGRSQYASRLDTLKKAIEAALAEVVEHAARDEARGPPRKIEVVSIPKEREHPLRASVEETVVEWNGLDIVAAIAALDGISDDDMKATGALLRRLRGNSG